MASAKEDISGKRNPINLCGVGVVPKNKDYKEQCLLREAAWLKRRVQVARSL